MYLLRRLNGGRFASSRRRECSLLEGEAKLQIVLLFSLEYRHGLCEMSLALLTYVLLHLLG